MLLRRLPRPQLLLPAWSARQLPSNQRYMTKGKTLPVQRAARPKPSAPLFEILFPEEAKAPEKVEASVQPGLENKVKKEDGQKLQWGKLNEWLSSTETTSSPEDAIFGSEIDDTVRKADSEAMRRRRNASVMVLSNASKALMESDFLRLSPRGKHIDGWAAGIIKVIPGRDPQTLERLGYYFILFSSDAAARAYSDQVLRLHSISRSYTSSAIPIPPGYIKDGEDIEALLKAFTLVPASQQRPALTMLKKPFRPFIARMVSDGALPVLAQQQSKSEALVLFTLDKGHMSNFDLQAVLGKDGRTRNRFWNLWKGGSKGMAIHKLESARTAETKKGDFEQEGDMEAPRPTRRPPSRFVIAFQDMQEARRFVRAWHRRELPPLRDVERNPEDEIPPIVSTELLW